LNVAPRPTVVMLGAAYAAASLAKTSKVGRSGMRIGPFEVTCIGLTQRVKKGPRNAGSGARIDLPVAT
jgi:hypothetical protein